jgi:hypothetical protein
MMIYLVSYKTRSENTYHLYYNSDDSLIYESRTYHNHIVYVNLSYTSHRYDISNHSLHDCYGVVSEVISVELPEIKNIYDYHITYSENHILEMVEKVILENI